MIEADIVAPPQIFFHPEARERDPKNLMVALELLHQVDPASVRQPDVADQNIETLVRRRRQRGLHAVRRLHVITPPPKKLRQRPVRVLMVFDQQHPH